MSDKKAQHTPGPWYSEDRDERLVILAEGADYEIASVDAPDEGNPEHASRLGDADLITAAPDLLAALVQLTTIRDGQAGYNEAFKAALAAIAKARGK